MGIDELLDPPKVIALNEPAELKAALQSGETVLVPARQVSDFQDFMKKELPDMAR